MVNELEIRIGTRSTHVRVETGGLSRVGEMLAVVRGAGRASTVAVVSDSTVAGLYGEAAAESLCAAGWKVEAVTIEPGEGSKSFAAVQFLYEAFARAGLHRDGLVLALGGGVVSDVAGFAAATWMRGVEFAICPTTLEAQIDAAIGGKTAINISAGKNLVGAFHPASFVLIDPACLSTLAPRDVRAGMAESIKHAMITSEEFFGWHEEHVDDVLSLRGNAMEELILRNVKIKAAIVERDPFETMGERRVLNFGHTIGHAIENACGYELRHGECVALGMLAACRISNRLTGLPESVTARLEKLLARFGLPTKLSNPPPVERILDMMKLDKKVQDGRIHFLLLAEVGQLVARDDVGVDAVTSAYESLMV